MEKSGVLDSTITHDGGESLDNNIREKAGPVEDIQNMNRLGKQQLFKRNFSFVSVLGFILILMGTWKRPLGTIAFGLGASSAPASPSSSASSSSFMAKMASMAPTSGGQYHWVSEFAPRRYQRLMSYLIGCLNVLGHQISATIDIEFKGKNELWPF